MFGFVWMILKETVNDYIDDSALSRGAAIAYYTILSIGPVLFICIAIAGLAFGQEAAQGAIVEQMRGMMGEQGAQALQTMIASASSKSAGIWATILGIATLVVTASGVFVEMQASLNAIWKAEPPAGVSGLIKARAASLGLVATMGFLLLVSLVASAGLSAAGTYLNRFLPFAELLLQVINFIVSFLLVSLLFGAIYKILPDRALGWRDVGVGALATAFLFTIGKTGIGLYIGSSSVASSYGAAGAFVIVLLWIYYSSQIFLLGAEFTKVWASHHGSAEAFAARMEAPAGPPPKPGPATAVQNVIAHTAAQRTKVGMFEVAALVTLAVAAWPGRTRR